VSAALGINQIKANENSGAFQDEVIIEHKRKKRLPRHVKNSSYAGTNSPFFAEKSAQVALRPRAGDLPIKVVAK
jgi:hypothetical protein